MNKIKSCCGLFMVFCLLTFSCKKDDEPEYWDEEYDVEVNGLAYSITSLENYEVALMPMTYPSNYSGDIKVPETIEVSGRNFTVTSVSYNAFFESSITSIFLPESIITIGDYAFFNCKNLKNINLPINLETIGSGAFYASGLEAISVPPSVKYIYSGNFLNCRDIKSIYLEDSEDPIYVYESYWDYNYYDDADYSANKLEKVYIGRNIDDYYSTSFDYYESEALKEVSVGKYVSKIRGYFNNSLTFKVYTENPPQASCSASNEFFMNSQLYVPSESMEMYKEATFWGQFWNINSL